MNVSEALKNYGEILGTEVLIEGVAEISRSFAVIYNDHKDQENTNTISPGILIHGELLHTLVISLPEPIPGYCGSEISYVLAVKVLGIVANTGYRFAPLKFGHIYEVEFDDVHTGIQKVSVNARLKNVIIKVERSLKAIEVKALEKYFPAHTNILELKKTLENSSSITLLRRVLEPTLKEHLNLLEKMKIAYSIEESPIENGTWGMP